MTPARAHDKVGARAALFFLFDRAEPRGLRRDAASNYSGATQEFTDIVDVEPTVAPMIDG